MNELVKPMTDSDWDKFERIATCMMRDNRPRAINHTIFSLFEAGFSFLDAMEVLRLDDNEVDLMSRLMIVRTLEVYEELSAEVVAERLQVDRSTVHRWKKDGEKMGLWPLPGARPEEVNSDA